MSRTSEELVLKALSDALAYIRCAAAECDEWQPGSPLSIQVKSIESEVQSIIADHLEVFPKSKGTLSSLLDRILGFDP